MNKHINHPHRKFGIITFLDLIYILIVFSLLNRILKLNLPKFFSLNYGPINNTDFHINYAAGFIRRGLDGEIIYFIAKILNMISENVIKTYYSIFWFFAALIFGYIFVKKKLPIFVLFSPFLLYTPFLSFPKGLFKDMEGITFFFLIIGVQLFIKKEVLKIIATNLLLILLMSVHEVYFIFVIPCLVYAYLISNSMDLSIKNLLNFIKFYSPSIVFFIFLNTVFIGNEEKQKIILNSWYILDTKIEKRLSFNDGVFNGKLNYIWLINGKIWYKYFGLLLNVVFNFMFSFLITKTYFNGITKKKLALIISSNLLIILLCIIASDFSRWILLTNTAILITFFLSEEKYKSNSIKKENNYFVEKLALFSLTLIAGITYFTDWSIFYFKQVNIPYQFYEYCSRLIL